VRRCPVTGFPVDACDCGGCWDEDDPMTEAVAQAWRDDGSDEGEAQTYES
jgi:hypothetical protein